MRHAERVDRIFPDWVRRAFLEGNRYQPYDLNMPVKVTVKNSSSTFRTLPMTTLIRNELYNCRLFTMRMAEETPAFLEVLSGCASSRLRNLIIYFLSYTMRFLNKLIG